MARILLAAVVLVWSTTAARADLSVQSIQASYGPLGPERKSRDYFPHDEVFYRYTLTGLQMDRAGDIDIVVESKVIDGDGKLLPGSRDPIKGKLLLAGGTFRGSSVVRLGSTFAPGEYTLSVTITDNLAAESVQFTRKFAVKAAEFAIVAPRFFYGDTAVPAPAGGLVGQLVRVRFKAIGFDKSQGKIDAELALQVFDGDGKPLLDQPKRGTLSSTDAAEVKNATHLNFTEVIGLNRAGAFTLRLTVTDKVGQQTTTLELPLVVREP